jgi:nucleoid-associated protein YgaU
MTARRMAIFGLVILLAVALGVFARWQVARNEAAAPQTESAPVTAETAPQTVAPMPEEPGRGDTRPTFDVVRVERGGEAIIAGRAAPGTEVELLANGKVIDRTTANEAGEFVLMPPPLQPGSHELALRTKEAGSRQAVTVSVPQPGSGEVLVVVGEPGKPSQVVQAGAPEGPNAGALSQVPGYVQTPAGADTPLRIGAVEAEGGRLFVQGSGPPGGKTVIYLNEAPLAEATVGPDGRWSLTVSKGLSAGEYRIRIDQTGPDGKVIARAEVPFTSQATAVARTEPPPVAQSAVPPSASSSPPAAMAPPASAPVAPPSALAASAPEAPAVAAAPRTPAPETTSSAPSARPAPPPSPVPETAAAPQEPVQEPATTASANPVVSQVETFEVKRGDSLWQISRQRYGAGTRYSTIYEANSDQIRDPDRIYPGQIFVVPGG